MRRKISTGVMVSFAVLVLALGAAGALLTPQPFFCRTCHVERDIYKAWTKSPHNEISCLSCHRKPGVSGYLTSQVEMAKRVSSSIFGTYQKPLTSNVDNSSCLPCHKEILKGTVVRSVIKVRHRDFLQEGQACTDCHSGVGHKNTVRKQENPTMDKCTTCHNGKTASKTCKICHVEKAKRKVRNYGPWQVTHGKDWRKTHGMGNLTSCIICHSKEDCSRCHLEMPHVQNWPYYHGKMALKNDCFGCHIQSYCVDCHRIEMPHPESFLPRHSAIVEKKGGELCYRCHVRDDCQYCHVRHVHPGIKQPIPVPEGR